MATEFEKRIKDIEESIENENISTEEILFLQDHQQEVLETGDVRLCEWAGITEEEFNNGKLSIFNRIIFSTLDNDIVNDGYGNRQKYEVELNYNGRTYTTYYTDSVMAYRNGEDIDFKQVMECLLLDKSAYDSCTDIDDFQNQFGYEKVSECLKAYNGCKETSEALERLFTEEELEQLREELEV